MQDGRRAILYVIAVVGGYVMIPLALMFDNPASRAICAFGGVAVVTGAMLAFNWRNLWGDE
jgi:hypothetical protein